MVAELVYVLAAMAGEEGSATLVAVAVQEVGEEARALSGSIFVSPLPLTGSPSHQHRINPAPGQFDRGRIGEPRVIGPQAGVAGQHPHQQLHGIAQFASSLG